MWDLVCTFSPSSSVLKIKNVKVTCACFWRPNKDSNVLADSICGTHSLPCSLKEDEVGENISVGGEGRGVENKKQEGAKHRFQKCRSNEHRYQLPTAFPPH